MNLQSCVLDNAPPAQITFSPLHTVPEIAEIRHLREGIDLSPAALADPHFKRLEKKETSAGLWEFSAVATMSSAPSVQSH